MPRERLYRITPINPFTPAQAQIAEDLCNGLSAKEIANMRGSSLHTVNNIIYGYTPGGTVGQIGIRGVVHRLTGKRPHNDLELFNILYGDVLLEIRD